MAKHVLVAIVILLLCMGVFSCAKGTPEDTDKTDRPGSPSAVKYENSAAGFKKCIEDVYAAVKADDASMYGPLVKDFKLPDAEAFFTEHFGAECGKLLAEEYEKMAKSFDEAISGLLKSQLKRGRTNLKISMFEDPKDRNATGLQQKALANMKKKTALYSVRFLEPGKDLGFHLWNFAHYKGTFRLVGKMRAINKYLKSSK